MICDHKYSLGPNFLKRHIFLVPNYFLAPINFGVARPACLKLFFDWEVLIQAGAELCQAQVKLGKVSKTPRGGGPSNLRPKFAKP